MDGISLKLPTLGWMKLYLLKPYNFNFNIVSPAFDFSHNFLLEWDNRYHLDEFQLLDISKMKKSIMKKLILIILNQVLVILLGHHYCLLFI